MANIDKNPRQITRLRVEDQKKLEKIAGDSEFLNDSLPHRLTTALEIVSERGFGLENSDAIFWMSNDYNDITIGSNADGELVIDNGFDTYHLPYDSNPDREGITADIVTSDKLKTLFGNQSIYGNGNIDLYKHYLKITGTGDGGTSSFYILVQSSSNVDCSSTTGATQKLKDLLKVSGTQPIHYEYGVTIDATATCQLVWTGSLLVVNYNTVNYNITKIEDRVETL